MTGRFNHWHTHSMYSVLDGLSRVPDMVARTEEIGGTALAITDHASISALPDLFNATKDSGVKPVVGCEFYVVDRFSAEKGAMKDVPRYHLTVWARNWHGVESIMDKLTLANTQFYRRPLLTIEQAMEFHDCIIGTACCFGVLSHPDYQGIVERLAGTYGEDVVLEVMPHKVVLKGETEDRQHTVNMRAMELASAMSLPLLATNDSHYTRQEDSDTHGMLLAIQYGKQVGDMEGWGDSFYMRDMKDMVSAFKALEYVPDSVILSAVMCATTMADKVNIVMPSFEVHLPDVHDDDAGFAQRILADGWKEKISGKVGTRAKEYHVRLIYELGVIKKMGFVKYFLMVDDIIRWSRAQGIMVGPGRGSAAGSLVCYLMGITQLDPIKHGLYFERFLNPERVNLPDIDVDFQDDRRSEVIDYIVNKYGQECVGQINTFGMLTVKSAFRDVARVFGINNMQVNILSKQIEDESSFENVPELASFASQFPEVVRYVKELSGTIRQVGVHACGLSVASRPLREVCAVERRKDGFVSCWDMRNCEKFGLLKMDILGLTTLTILAHARKLVMENYGTDIDFAALPLDDEKTMAMFAAGECAGIFQFEGAAMSDLLRNLQASDFETITAATALYRPGPLQAGLTDRFVKIAQGRESERYSCPQLEPILTPTRSILIYQEQIMRIFSELGGFSWAHADQMRKIIGKKLGKDEFDKHRMDFIAGCQKNGIAEYVADDLFNDMAEFASYSFNKCVSGDTVLMKPAKGRFSSDYSIREAYRIKNDIGYAKETGHFALRSKWITQGGYGYGMSACEDGRIRKNKIVDIQPAGVRDVYRVTLVDGSFIDATSNHAFPTPCGKRKLSDISVGDHLYKCGEKGYPVELVEIASIECIGKTDTYDVTMEAPNHNFVIDNGIVTCNSHAAAYALLSVWSMYLKANYPAEYLAACLTCAKSEDTQATMVVESKRLGVPVERPDINRSTARYELEDGKIIAPLWTIKGVGEKAVECILEARKDGVFLSREDMVERVNRRVVNVRIVALLERAGAFESLGLVEADPEQREKSFAELLPMLNEAPVLSLVCDRFPEECFEAIRLQVEQLAKDAGKSPIHAEHGQAPVIMAINMPTRGEKRLLSKTGTKHFQKSLAQYGITMRHLYYTSVLKVHYDNPTKAPKKAIYDGLDVIKQEIVALEPKLIVCFASQAIPLFVPDGKISKLNGKVVYSKQYDSYVLFSFSPQYAAYKADEVGALFDANMVKIYEMFGGAK